LPDLSVDNGQRVELVKDPVLGLAALRLRKLVHGPLRGVDDALRHVSALLEQAVVEQRAVVHVLTQKPRLVLLLSIIMISFYFLFLNC
jgi:hypothetical protein